MKKEFTQEESDLIAKELTALMKKYKFTIVTGAPTVVPSEDYGEEKDG